jgi:hypothetical protein
MILDVLHNIVELWPLFILAFAITAAGVRLMIRNDSYKNLHKADGSLIYLSEAKYKEGFNAMVDDMNDRCANHRESCRSTLCMKIDGVLIKLDKMDEQRDDARKESNESVGRHTVEIQGIGKEVSRLVGRFDTLEKTVITNGIKK